MNRITSASRSTWEKSPLARISAPSTTTRLIVADGLMTIGVAAGGSSPRTWIAVNVTPIAATRTATIPVIAETQAGYSDRGIRDRERFAVGRRAFAGEPGLEGAASVLGRSGLSIVAAWYTGDPPGIETITTA